jgi:hypothetical protein
MNTLNNESAKVKKANVANANAGQLAGPFYAAIPYQSTARVLALFWSVFGPAARYDFQDPENAYAVSLKP